MALKCARRSPWLLHHAPAVLRALSVRIPLPNIVFYYVSLNSTSIRRSFSAWLLRVPVAPLPLPDSYKMRMKEVIQSLRQKSPPDFDAAESEAMVILGEIFQRSGGAYSPSGLADARAHFAVARERVRGLPMVEVLDELEAAILPIIERMEAKFRDLEVNVDGLKTLVGRHEATIGQHER